MNSLLDHLISDHWEKKLGLLRESQICIASSYWCPDNIRVFGREERIRAQSLESSYSQTYLISLIFSYILFIRASYLYL